MQSIEELCVLMERTQLFVLDMDGTFYLGDQILEGALDFLNKVEKAGKQYLFFTNNSSKAPEDYIRKLANMNCRITPERIMTSGDVTIAYLKANFPGKSVYLLGTPALEESFRAGGIELTREKADIVVAGFDLALNYEKLERACTEIRNGAVFLATHPDINCPTENGFIPDCGAFCAAISLSTGVQPRYLGKPCAETAEMIESRTGIAREHIAFVGDRLYTDVAVGVQNGAMGLLVLTGETKESDLEHSAIKPDAVFPSLAEIGFVLDGMR